MALFQLHFFFFFFFAKCLRVGEDGPWQGHLCHIDKFLVSYQDYVFYEKIADIFFSYQDYTPFLSYGPLKPSEKIDSEK